MTQRAPTPSWTWVDRAVAWASPLAGIRRWQGRCALAMRGQVEAIESHRLRSEWKNVSVPADQTAVDRQKIRNVVRRLVLNNPYASGAVSRIVANVVGRGIVPQSALTAEAPGTKDAPGTNVSAVFTEEAAGRFRKQAEAAWAMFADRASLDGQQTFAEIQALVERLHVTDGEAFLHLPQVKRKNWPFSFGVEPIDADRVCSPIGRATQAGFVDGIEIDLTTGAPVAYHVATADPLRPLTYQRIAAFASDGRPQMLHDYTRTRPGQYRGLSELTPALGIFEDLHRYWEAEIVAARTAACYSAFVNSPAATSGRLATGTVNSAGEREEEMKPGMIWYGLPGENVTFGDPKRPNSAFGSFSEILLRAIGVCLDLPFELVALDFSKTNYSSARAALLEARRKFQQRQRRHETYGSAIWRMVIQDAIAAGMVEVPAGVGPDDYLRCFWSPPGWGWVDPRAEVAAAQASVRNMFSSMEDELGAQGRDFDATIAKIAWERDRLQARKLPTPWDPQTEAQIMASAAGAAAEEAGTSLGDALNAQQEAEADA